MDVSLSETFIIIKFKSLQEKNDCLKFIKETFGYFSNAKKKTPLISDYLNLLNSETSNIVQEFT